MGVRIKKVRSHFPPVDSFMNHPLILSCVDVNVDGHPNVDDKETCTLQSNSTQMFCFNEVVLFIFLLCSNQDAVYLTVVAHGKVCFCTSARRGEM